MTAVWPFGRRDGAARGRWVRRVVAIVAVAGLAAVGSVAPAFAGSTSTLTSASITSTWVRTLGLHRLPWFGSPGVAIINGRQAVISGDRTGNIYAYYIDDGSTVPGWPYRGPASVMSTPSVETNPDGSARLIFVGLGESPTPGVGGLLALRPNGTKAWYRQVRSRPYSKGGFAGMMSSAATGPLESGGDVIGGQMGQMQYAFNGATGNVLSGWPWFQADTNFSTPALADLKHNGHDYVIEGGDSTAGMSIGGRYTQGGHIRVLRPTGHAGSRSLASGLACQYNTNQVVQSSPAVGPFLAGGALGIVSGTGRYFSGASDTNKVIAVTTSCKLAWKSTLNGDTGSSPAIADVNGDGSLDVVEISHTGTVYALRGTDGSKLWTRSVGNPTYSSVVTFPDPFFDGVGIPKQYIIASTGVGAFVLDGSDGQIVATIASHQIQLRSAATVTVDGPGLLGITITGLKSSTLEGVVAHYTVPVASNDANLKAAWPMFHHDPQLRGVFTTG